MQPNEKKVIRSSEKWKAAEVAWAAAVIARDDAIREACALRVNPSLTYEHFDISRARYYQIISSVR
jgi:hypothetical protein